MIAYTCHSDSKPSTEIIPSAIGQMVAESLPNEYHTHTHTHKSAVNVVEKFFVI